MNVSIRSPSATEGIWFLWTFRRARTPVDTSKPTARIVTHGPFGLSRNPGYVSLTVMSLGLAFAANALWALAQFEGARGSDPASAIEAMA